MKIVAYHNSKKPSKSEEDIVTRWIDQVMASDGHCDVVVEFAHGERRDFGLESVIGYVAKLEGNGTKGAFSVVLRPMLSDCAPSSIIWIIDFSAREQVHQVQCAKLINVDREEFTVEGLHSNSAISKITLFRSYLDSRWHAEQQTLGLDVDFAWKCLLLPSDDDEMRESALSVTSRLMDDLKNIAVPSDSGDKWSKHLLANPSLKGFRTR